MSLLCKGWWAQFFWLGNGDCDWLCKGLRSKTKANCNLHTSDIGLNALQWLHFVLIFRIKIHFFISDGRRCSDNSIFEREKKRTKMEIFDQFDHPLRWKCDDSNGTEFISTKNAAQPFGMCPAIIEIISFHVPFRLHLRNFVEQCTFPLIKFGFCIEWMWPISVSWMECVVAVVNGGGSVGVVVRWYTAPLWSLGDAQFRQGTCHTTPRTRMPLFNIWTQCQWMVMEKMDSARPTMMETKSIQWKFGKRNERMRTTNAETERRASKKVSANEKYARMHERACVHLECDGFCVDGARLRGPSLIWNNANARIIQWNNVRETGTHYTHTQVRGSGMGRQRDAFCHFRVHFGPPFAFRMMR